MATNYLANARLRRIIDQSKLTYCSYIEPDHAVFDHVIRHRPEDTSFEHLEADVLKKRNHSDVTSSATSVGFEVGQIIRYMIDDHIPRLEEPRKTRTKTPHLPSLPFPPFRHYLVEPDFTLTEVLRSHWVGGFENGHFSATSGRMTNEVGEAIQLLVHRYGSKPNFASYSYLDEMRADALVHLCNVALQFDESKSDNPFSYWTTCVHNVFLRRLNQEAKQSTIRDDLLVRAAASPSLKAQGTGLESAGAIGWTELEPHQKKSKRGRPRKNP